MRDEARVRLKNGLFTYPMRDLGIPALLATFFAVYMIQLPLIAEVTGLDPAWHRMLIHAYKTHQQHGRDFIFNYGPLSFLVAAQFDSEILPIRMISWALYYAIFGITLAVVLKVDTLLKAAFVCLYCLPLVVFPDIHLLIPSVLLGYLEIDRRQGDRSAMAISALLAIQMAFMGLIKSTALFLALPILILVTAYRLYQRDWFPVPLLVFLLATTALLAVGRQDYSAVVDFYVAYLDVSRAYNADMQLPAGMLHQVALVAGGVLILASVPYRARGGFLHGVLLLGYLLVIYKLNFTRQGAHPQISFAGLAVPLLCQIMLPERCLPKPWFRATLITVALACLATAHILRSILMQDEMSVLRYGRIFEQRLQLLIHPGFRGNFWRAQETARAEVVAKVRTAMPFKSMEGPVDAFPFEVGKILDSGMEAATRPAFQAYFATSRLMTERNLAFLESDAAPKSVLFSITPIDGRYATLEDPLTQRAYRRLYQPRDSTPEVLLLERRAQPLLEQEICRETYTMLGQTVPLPPTRPDEALWVRLNLTTTAKSRIAELLAPPPELRLEIATPAGTSSYRYLQESGTVGFLLSPALTTTDGAGRFFAGQTLPQDTVLGFKLMDAQHSPAGWYEEGIPVTLCTLSWKEPG
ncbi:hypothetical protein ACFSM5_17305 [Lacibacterium aquatile]|uniref:Uncharacterized protein n=1 Tax=Lacibacterium aquatile TaxID=1168082 RepID=A0ABW5DYZ5_9PROT